MAPTRYSLHYEDYSEHLMSRFGKLLQMQSLVDMTLMCSSHTLRVHKAVLAASSSYFQEVLQNQTGEPLIVLKMRFSVLKSLVEFMYCGKTQCLEDNLDELVAAAQFLKIKGLSKVTREGLGISNTNELPTFTPPVVISRPPQSLIELNSQENIEPKFQMPHQAGTNSHAQIEQMSRPSKEMVVRIPFDIEKGGATTSVNYVEPPRSVKPRRGRPSARRSGWEGGHVGRAAEKALMRREQDSRKAIHHLKHLQNKHMQDYLDQVTLTQAVNSICGPENATSSNYLNLDSNYMYMDQPATANPPPAYEKVQEPGRETQNYSAPSTSANENANIGSAMSEYVNALKSAGLPTDLPILFESGDGSYVNVNEQVLLDMVQSSEIQYEVIDQPNIMGNVADPTGIKSIDDLSKSIERGEMMVDLKSYAAPSSFDKSATQFRHDDAINSLDAILPDNLESFGDQPNYVVLDSHLPSNTLDSTANDFSCIDGDMQFFTKSMSEDVKKYYEGQTLDESRDMDLCPTSTTLDTSFTISLLDTKTSNLNNNIQTERNDDCYDFSLQLSQIKDFKDDALDCLISTPKRTENDSKMHDEDGANERAKIIKDLMNIEKTINLNRNQEGIDNASDFSLSLNEAAFDIQCSKDLSPIEKSSDGVTAITSSGLQWEGIDLSKEDESRTEDSTEINSKGGNDNNGGNDDDHINQGETGSDKALDEINACNEFDESNVDSTVEEDIPYAVGLQPLQAGGQGQEGALKRGSPSALYSMDNMDAKCLRRKAKHKKL